MIERNDDGWVLYCDCCDALLEQHQSRDELTFNARIQGWLLSNDIDLCPKCLKKRGYDSMNTKKTIL